MSQDYTVLASAINLAEVASHPAEALAALIEIMKRQGKEIELLQENQTILFGLLAKLKDQINPKPTEAQADRATVLRALLAANGGKMLAKDARHQLGLSETVFSRLLSKMKDHIEVKEFHANRRNNVIVLKSAKG